MRPTYVLKPKSIRIKNIIAKINSDNVYNKTMIIDYIKNEKYDEAISLCNNDKINSKIELLKSDR